MLMYLPFSSVDLSMTTYCSLPGLAGHNRRKLGFDSATTPQEACEVRHTTPNKRTVPFSEFSGHTPSIALHSLHYFADPLHLCYRTMAKGSSETAIDKKKFRTVDAYFDNPEAGKSARMQHYLCMNCGARPDQKAVQLKNCVACHRVSYCSKACQREHWKAHKYVPILS